MHVTVVIPTFNEQGNAGELVARLDRVLSAPPAAGTAVSPTIEAELLFVDDSDDDTPEAIRVAAATAHIPVTVHHRDAPLGGLSGAVVDGIRHSTAEWVVVMDGDLQHPPEYVPALLAAATGGVDVVAASRYRAGGSSGGLDSPLRRLASLGTTYAARVLFPRRLHGCTDPMTGFFAVRRDAVDTGILHPQGFKILLEILGRHRLRVTETPFTFAARGSGVSKATLRQGMEYLTQLVALRMSRRAPARRAQDIARRDAWPTARRDATHGVGTGLDGGVAVREQAPAGAR